MKYLNKEKSAVLIGTSSIMRGSPNWSRLGIDKAEETDVIKPYVKPAPSAEEVFTNTIQPLVSGISQVERDTFERQEREALEWIADNEAPVKFTRGLAEARGITMGVLVKKITDKANIYSEHLAKALGAKHKAEDQLVDDNA